MSSASEMLCDRDFFNEKCRQKKRLYATYSLFFCLVPCLSTFGKAETSGYFTLNDTNVFSHFNSTASFTTAIVNVSTKAGVFDGLTVTRKTSLSFL